MISPDKTNIMSHLKSIIKTFIGIGFLPIGKKFTKNKLTVFCYHDVTHNPSEFSDKYHLNVPPNIFEYQIDFINQKFNVINPDDLLSDRIPSNAALITFDDGFKSYFENAVPILEKYNTPSIIFLNMAPINGEIFWSGLITYLCSKSPEFYQYMINNSQFTLIEKPLYLYCSREIVNSFLKTVGNTFKDEVKKFVGDFGTEKDLKSVINNNLVYFGNHLYNHYVPLLLSDKELLESFRKNEDELDKYPNYRSLFAFPFGQPDTCFSKQQIELLIKNGAKKVFSSYFMVNNDISDPYLHRIPLHSFNNSNARIWFSILRKSFKI